MYCVYNANIVYILVICVVGALSICNLLGGYWKIKWVRVKSMFVYTNIYNTYIEVYQ